MPLTVPVGTGQVSWEFLYGLDPDHHFVTFAIGPGGGLGPTHVQRLSDAWRLAMMPQLSSSLGLVNTILRVRQDDGTDLIHTFPIATAGGGLALAPTPSNTAILVQKVTTRGGRRGKGRMYVPGCPEANVDQDGFLTVAYRASLQTAVNNLLDRLTAPAGGGTAGDPVAPRLLHNSSTQTTVQTSPTARIVTTTITGPGPAPDAITGFLIAPQVATQRRRMRS